jgi:hypothetical protein
MLIQAYGLFWDKTEIVWQSGRGRRKTFQLLGRIGTNRGTLRMADMRDQTGIYVLHDDWGVYYVGLTRKQSLGKRLKDHVDDEHAEKWQRFSWFGFNQVLKSRGPDNLCVIKPTPQLTLGTPHDAIRDMEALLIQLHNPRGNVTKMKFQKAEKWTQVEWDESNKYLNRL